MILHVVILWRGENEREKLREEGCFFLFSLKIYLKKKKKKSRSILLLCLVFFPRSPQTGVAAGQKGEKKPEMCFFFCFFPECVFKTAKPQVCFISQAVFANAFFLPTRRD